jgi:type II secretory pathway pseudopilin PulG
MGRRHRAVLPGHTPDPGCPFGGTPNPGEAGFSLIECTIALALVFVVLLALLGALTTGARGLVTGRQRSAALALANEVLEDARGRAYGDVGHDFDSDPTLATDPLITGTAPNFVYTGVTPNEPLAASAVDAGATGGTVNNPLFPFSPHKFTSQREQTIYTTEVHISIVTPASGDQYKRITAKVSWAPAQYATAARSVTLSSFLFNAGAPPDPKLIGEGEADAGSFEVTGTLAGISLSDAQITLPYVNGGIDSGFVRSAKGFARSGTSQVNLLSGLLSGCSLLGLGSTCDPALVEADADNDSGTAPPDTDQDGPTSAASATISAGTALTVGLGSGTAQAQASARSCWSCQPGGSLPVGDDDRLPYFTGTATGPGTTSVDFLAGVVGGKLLSIGTGCAAGCATVTVDRDDSGANQRLASTASVSFPALSLMTFSAGNPAGYSGMIRIGAVSATATANSGPGATSPSVTGTPVVVQMWDTATGGYKNITVTPGDAPPATDPTASASFSILGLSSVTMNATLHWNKAVTSESSSGGAITDASASLTNWLFVDLHVTITTLGVPVADLNLHLDYGRIAATAGYQPVS